MAEEPAVQVLPETPAVTPVETPAITPVVAPVYFNNDGTLGEGWQSTLEEGYRNEASLSTVKDTKLLAKMFVDTKRMVGKDTISIPTDTSTEVEWETYHKAGGRPETVEDYGLKLPEGIDENIAEIHFPKERITKWQERFFKGGVSKKAAEGYITDFVNDIMSDLKAIQQQEQLDGEDLTRGLVTDWGAAYEQNKHLGNIAIEEGTTGNDELKARVVDKFGTDPDFIRFASNLGKKFAEGKSPNLTNVPTPADLQTQIDELMANPILLSETSTAAQRKQIMDRIMAIREKMPVKTT